MADNNDLLFSQGEFDKLGRTLFLLVIRAFFIRLTRLQHHWNVRISGAATGDVLKNFANFKGKQLSSSLFLIVSSYYNSFINA